MRLLLQDLRLAGEGAQRRIAQTVELLSVEWGDKRGGGVLQVGRRSLVWGFVGFQKLLRERVDLVSTSNFVGQ